MAIARVLAFVMSRAKPTRASGPSRPPQATKVPAGLPTRPELKRRRATELRDARSGRAAAAAPGVPAARRPDQSERDDAGRL